MKVRRRLRVFAAVSAGAAAKGWIAFPDAVPEAATSLLETMKSLIG